METRKNKLWYLFILLNSLIHAQSPLSLSYSEYISFVKQNNPLAARAMNQSEFGKAQLRAARGAYDPFLSAEIQNKQFKSREYYTLGNAEIKQPIFTNQYLKAGFEYGQGANINPENITPSYGLPYLGVEAGLLQGLLFDKRRAEVIKAKHYQTFYSEEQRIQLNDLLFESAGAYFELLYRKKELSLQNYFSSLAGQRLTGVLELAKVGERAAVDTVEATIFLQSRLLEQQAAQLEILKQQALLGVYYQPNNQPAFTSPPVITDTIEQYYNKALSVLSAIVKDTVNNPVLNQYRAKQKIAETDARLKRELIKPKLDVGYNFLSSSEDVYSPAFNSNNYKWKASLAFPLFLRAQRNEYKMSTLIAQNNRLELSNKNNELDFKRKYLLESITITSAQIKNAERAATNSRIMVDAERMKFINGESSLFLLNARESKWLETELKLAELRLKFIKTILSIIHLNGSLNYELQ